MSRLPRVYVCVFKVAFNLAWLCGVAEHQRFGDRPVDVSFLLENDPRVHHGLHLVSYLFVQLAFNNSMTNVFGTSFAFVFVLLRPN